MKKVLVIAALAVFGFANAQKGTILLAGNVGYNMDNTSFTNSENKANTFVFSPKVGYQFTDKWTAGIEATVFSTKTENNNDLNPNVDTEDKTNALRVGAFVRYSMPLSETFSVYADMGAGYQTVKNENTSFNGFFSTTATDKGNGFYVGITPALFINMKKGFGLNFGIGGIGYDSLSFDTSDRDESNFAITFGQSFNIGISKNF
jgi:opacity protein-like surface antigen